ncbi:DUF3164 family protein [Phaeobacter sp. HF9A]|uniref:DUF3164 family protein n=1 Tax=Phaeobacter sp. HF9A TaxID=2721561 RepID=UPI001430A593|nr:DUF3164 family protein [Phaeobacter sp. HF9A]NIZ13929.1 DUF3164 family protein [Phaeobacter sp. HF9A]
MTEQHVQKTTPSRQPVTVPGAEETINGVSYMRNANGDLRATELVKPQDKLQDQTVREIIGYALSLSAEVSRFKQHTFEDIGAFEAILAGQYGATVGGKKGNKTLMSYDGLFKVQVQVADLIDFGPELQVAKSLVDECLTEWAADARPEIRDIVTRAFNTDKAGQINRSEIFMLLRLEIEDERWLRAMQAIRDAIRVVGSKTYVRCYQRPALDAGWNAIQIDLAKA